MTATLTDWRQSLGPATRRREAAAWVGAALAVAVGVTATAALALRLEDRLGVDDALEDAIFIELQPDPPQPSVAALPEAAPEVPMIEAPQALQSEDLAEPEPPLAKPPSDVRPPTELAQLPDMAAPVPDSFSPPPPPPAPPQVEEPVSELTADIRPVPRPVPEQEPERRKRAEPPPKQEASPPPRQQASTASAAQGRAPTAVPQGRLNDLKAAWGAQIRSRVLRRNSYPRAANGAEGTVVVRLSVSRSGALEGAGLSSSSGNAALDQAALRAVRAAGRFPSAPAQLPEASHVFTLPIKFDR